LTSIVDYCKCRRCFRRTPRVHLRNGLCKGCRRELNLPVLEVKNMKREQLEMYAEVIKACNGGEIDEYRNRGKTD
jgi:hypothetical protein